MTKLMAYNSMHSLSVRFNRIFFFGITTLAVMAFLNYLTGYYIAKSRYIEAQFHFVKHEDFSNFEARARGAQWDRLTSTFTLDLRKLKNLDNWNVKQLFLYLEATWEEKGKRNELIFWDRIIPRAEIPDSLVLPAQKMKYPICDLNQQLKNKVVTVNVWVEQVPVFGWIHRRKYASFQVKLPSHYTYNPPNK